MPTRREILATTSVLCAAELTGIGVRAAEPMPTRTIPSTGEALPVIGLGSSKAVADIAASGTGPLRDVLRTLVGEGGRVVDTWPRDADNDTAFGSIINLPDLRDALFVTTKIDRMGKEAGIAQFQATLRQYGRERVDLVQIFSLTDLDTHWPSLRDWKEAGLARYIGVTVADNRLYGELTRFLDRETPDFVQLNYSITERASEDRLIPMAADRGIAIIVNRPFMNGVYFQRLEGRQLPLWAAEFDCSSWAEFSLKYILANPLPTCVLTETTSPEHMRENTRAASGPMPDESMRARMRTYIDSI